MKATNPTTTFRRVLVPAVLALSLAQFGCGPDDNNGDGTNNGTAGSNNGTAGTNNDNNTNNNTDTNNGATNNVGTNNDTTNNDSACAVTPGEWSAEGFETNAAEALALHAALDALQGDLMNGAEQATWGDTPTAAPTEAEVVAAYEAGTPSLASVTPPALDTLVRQTFTDWTAALAEDPATYLFIDVDGTAWVATGAGGMHERPAADDGTRRFRAYSAGGAELRQLVDKGLFVGSMYNYALGLTEGTITPATVQAIAAAWGANPTLTPVVAEGEVDNEGSAHYSQSMGFYDETAAALTAAQAYAADEACTAERDAALVDVFRLWEEAMFARGTYYGGAPVRATLDPTDAETVLGPLHGLTEGLGLILGLRGIADPASGPLAEGARVSTDADIDKAIAALGVNIDDLSAGTTGKWLVEEPSTYNDGFNGDFKAVGQDVFGWTDAEFTEFSTNPVPTE